MNYNISEILTDKFIKGVEEVIQDVTTEYKDKADTAEAETAFTKKLIRVLVRDCEIDVNAKLAEKKEEYKRLEKEDAMNGYYGISDETFDAEISYFYWSNIQEIMDNGKEKG